MTWFAYSHQVQKRLNAKLYYVSFTRARASTVQPLCHYTAEDQRGPGRVNPEISPTQTHTLAIIKQQLIMISFGTTCVATLNQNAHPHKLSAPMTHLKKILNTNKCFFIGF